MTNGNEGTSASASRKGRKTSSPLGAAAAFIHSAVATSGALGSLVILFLTLLVVADVALRSFFALPIKGASEIGAFLVTAVVFLQTPLAVYEQRLTQLEWFGQWLRRTSPIAGTCHGAIVDAAGALAFLLIAKASWPGLIESWATAEFFGTQGHFTAPSWPVRLTIFACSLLAAIAFLLRIALHLASFSRRV